MKSLKKIISFIIEFAFKKPTLLKRLNNSHEEYLRNLEKLSKHYKTFEPIEVKHLVIKTSGDYNNPLVSYTKNGNQLYFCDYMNNIIKVINE